MRVIVFFDLPSSNLKEKRTAAHFRKFLITQGFSMMQCSVYIRIASNCAEAEHYCELVKRNRPSEGDIRCLKITEQQYLSISSDNDCEDYGTNELIVI